MKLLGGLQNNPESEVGIVLPKEYANLDLRNNDFVKISHESIYNNISGIKQVMNITSKDRTASLLEFNNPFALGSFALSRLWR